MISWQDKQGYSEGRPSFDPDLFLVIAEDDGEWLVWSPASSHDQGLPPIMRGKAHDFETAVLEVGEHLKEIYGGVAGDSGGPA